jgi:hypothetical protein
MSRRWTWVGLWTAVAAAETAALVPILPDGHLPVTSPAGEGTVVVAELPCES